MTLVQMVVMVEMMVQMVVTMILENGESWEWCRE